MGVLVGRMADRGVKQLSNLLQAIKKRRCKVCVFCIFVYLYFCVFVFLYICNFVYLYVCIFVFLCLKVCVCMCVTFRNTQRPLFWGVCLCSHVS